MKTKKRLLATLFGVLESDTAAGNTNFDFGEFTTAEHLREVQDICKVFYDLARKYSLPEEKNPFEAWHVYYDSILEKYYALPVIYDKDMGCLGLLTFNADGTLKLVE